MRTSCMMQGNLSYPSPAALSLQGCPGDGVCRQVQLQGPSKASPAWGPRCQQLKDHFPILQMELTDAPVLPQKDRETPCKGHHSFQGYDVSKLFGHSFQDCSVPHQSYWFFHGWCNTEVQFKCTVRDLLLKSRSRQNLQNIYGFGKFELPKQKA